MQIILGMGSTITGALVMGSPIGAAGGAIYGFCEGATILLAHTLIGDHSEDSKRLEVAKAVARLAIGMIGGVQLAGMMGVNLSLKSALILNVVGSLTIVGAGLVVVAALVACLAVCCLPLGQIAVRTFLEEFAQSLRQAQNPEGQQGQNPELRFGLLGALDRQMRQAQNAVGQQGQDHIFRLERGGIQDGQNDNGNGGIQIEEIEGEEGAAG